MRGKQPDALITVPQPPGLYGPLLYPTSTMGTAGLTLDFTVVHPVCRGGTEYASDENALHRAYGAKVAKHHGWLQAKNYWFVPVVAATSGALHPETLCTPQDGRRRATRRREWRLSSKASRPQLHGSLGSTGLRPMPPQYSRDLAHGPGVGSGLWPRLQAPTCSHPVIGVGLEFFVKRLLRCGLARPACPLCPGSSLAICKC